MGYPMQMLTTGCIMYVTLIPLKWVDVLQVADDQHLDPHHVLAADVAQLRAAGLSERKVSHHMSAVFFLSQSLSQLEVRGPL